MRLIGKSLAAIASFSLLSATAACDKNEKQAPTEEKTVEIEPTKVDEAKVEKTEEAKAEEKVEKKIEAKEEGHNMNWFGGEIYDGKPALDVTAALVKAGGGAEEFSFAKALVSMLGEDTVNAEVKKLTEQYGEKEVNTFISGMDYAVKQALKRAAEQKIAIPEPAPLEGLELAKTLVKAGVTSDGTFWSGYLFDKALSHDLHNLVMADIDTNIGREADTISHKILNQAMYDVAQALGMTDVKLADLH